MSERRRLTMLQKRRVFEWIRLGTSTTVNNNWHMHTAAVDFAHPIYGFAILTSSFPLATTWSCYMSFCYTPTNTPTKEYIGSYYSYSGYQYVNNDGIKYYQMTPSNTNKEWYYDESGTVVSTTSPFPITLNETIQIDGVDCPCNIRWQDMNNPKYLKQFQTGIYNCAYFAILVESGVPRTPAPLVTHT